MKRLMLLFSFILFLSAGIIAANEPGKTAVLSGKIIDKQTGETLTGVKVFLKGTNQYCYTNMDGNFFLPANTGSSQPVVIDLVGYEPIEFKPAALSLSPEITLTPR